MSWINIEERLPEYEQIVDLYGTWIGRDGTKRGMRITNVEYYPEMKNPWHPIDGEEIDDGLEITHWMPLPKQPK